MKFKLVRRSIQDQEADHILELAAMGMSRRCIALEVHGSKANGEPIASSLARVNHILRDYGMRVTDYRNGRNKEGRAVLAAIRREADIISAIRAAQNRVTQQLRQTA